MDKKYFFFDIDGTLTNIDTGELVPSAKEAIRLLQENGHFVSICTGRAYYKTKTFAKEAGFKHIVSNGGYCITVDGEVKENTPLNKEKAVALINECKEKNIGVLISPSDSIDVIMYDELFIEQVGLRQEPTRYILNRNLNLDDIDIYKIYIAISHEDEEKLTLRNTLGHIRFAPPYLTYQHDSKEKGIEKMIELVGGDLNNVVVFGDEVNDLVMFKDEYFKVALGSGNPILKEKADFVTKPTYEDGIMYACKHFGWIK